MNILVAGGAGFIGSNLCASLIKDGHKVVILDNLSTGSLANIRDLEYGTYTFVNEDVRTCDLGGIISIAIDVIINLACIASPKAYYKQPVDTLMTSVLGTKNLLDYALTQNAMLIQASTSEIYGDPNVDILEETYNGNVSCTGLEHVMMKVKEPLRLFVWTIFAHTRWMFGLYVYSTLMVRR